MVDWTVKTNLDELVNYPYEFIKKIAHDQRIVGLIMNDPNVDPYNVPEYNDDIINHHIFDYDYVSNLVERQSAYICVEADVLNTDATAIKDMALYIIVACHKDYMKLDSSEDMFKGIKGNRRDNIIRHISRLLHHSRDFGIGRLKLEQVRTIACTDGFTAKQMVYSASDFYQL